MSRVFITGSSDGLGLMAGRLLAADGHSVTLHARNQARADDTRAAPSQAALPQADGVVIGDLSSIAGMRQVAAQANASGRFDAVIHNAGIGYREARRVETEDGYFYHQQPRATHPAARDVKVQDELLGYCAELVGLELPR